MSNKNPKHKKKITSWELQQEKVKAEKDAKLKKLLEQEKPVYKKKTFDEKLAKKRQEQETNVVVKDNTATRNYNDATKHSNVARNKTDKEIAEERKAIREKSDANVLNSWSLDAFKPSNYTRKNIAEAAQGLESKFRVSDEPNFFDDYLNPAVIVGSMASNLGQAPLQAQQTDSYMPYVTAVGTPLALGAVGGIGAKNTGQFVNNLINPLAGTRDLINTFGNKFLPNAYKLNPYAFKASEDMGYRMLGKEGYQDAIESGVLRAKPIPNQPVSGGISLSRNTNRNPNTGKMQGALDRPYFADGFIDERYAADYMASVSKADNNLVPIPTHKGIAPAQAGSIPLENATLYQKDWLKGYKPIEEPKTTTPIGLKVAYLGTRDKNQQTSEFTLGGNLQQQTNNNNMLNEFNEGGSHEQNPLGGIPQGTGQNGQMNTVEEGETKKDNFIYSDRIKLTPELVSQFNLPKILANKTAAEATKIINTKFEGRNSTIDNSTKKAMLDRIAEAQETVKQVEAQKQAEIAEALNMNSTMAPEDQMNGEIPQGMEEFLPQQQMALGGFSDTLNSMGASGMLGQHTGINQLTTGVDLANTAFGKTGIDTSGATDVNPGNISVGGSTLSGLTKGAQAGAMFGPWGIGIGAAVGGVAGLVGGNRAKKDAMKAHQNFQIGQSNKLVSNFAFGGNLIGEPVVGEPSTINANIPITKEKLATVNLKPEEPLVQPTSRYKKMIGLQSGVVNDKKGEGYYYYYDKKPGDPGFNPEEHRDFVTSENHSLGQRYLLSDGKVNPQYNYQLNNYLSQNKGFKYGGNMYNDGGYLNRFKTSRIEDNPDYQAQGPEGFFKTNIPRVGSSLPKKGQFYKESFNQMRKPLVSNEIGFKSKLNYNDPELAPENVKSGFGETLNKVGQFTKDNYGNILRYSPVAMNALQLHKLNKSGYDTVNPMINNTRYNPQYMDEKALVNQINAESNYAGNALANSSNGSMGTLRDNILASQLAKTKGLSDAYSRVAEVNRNENKTGQQFNLGVDEANIARRIAAEDKTAMNKGNWETNKSRLLGQIGTDLGNIGLEQERNNMAEAMTGYTRKGKYLYKDDGTRVSADELKSTINNTMSSVGITEKDGKYFDASGKELTSTDVLKMINSKNTTNQNRFGGYILNGPFLNNRMIKRYK